MRIKSCSFLFTFTLTGIQMQVKRQTEDKCFNHLIALLHNGNSFSLQFSNLRCTKSIYFVLCKINFKFLINKG